MEDSKSNPAARQCVRKTTLEEQGDDALYYDSLTPEQRVAMVWPLTLSAWQFAFPDGFEHRLSRHVARVERGRS